MYEIYPENDASEEIRDIVNTKNISKQNIYQRRFSNALVFPVVAAFLLSAGVFSRGEVIFGNKRFGTGNAFRNRHLEFSKRGKFFTTTNKNLGGTSNPLYRSAWTSDGGETLCGVEFDYPIKPYWPEQFDRFEGGRPLFDRAVIWWGDVVPSPGTWSACVLTTTGKLVRLKPDNASPLYPSDRSTIRFNPLPVKKIYVGLKTLPDGGKNPASIRNINIYLRSDQNHALSNCVKVLEKDAFLAEFSETQPGIIASLWPCNDWFGARIPLFGQMTPVIEINGKTITPEKADGEVKVSKSDGADVVKYALTFELPGDADEIAVNVEYRFRQNTPR